MMLVTTLVDILAASWSVLGAMAPYLLLGFFFAGLLSVMVSPEWVEKHLGGDRFGQIFKASVFGVPLPLCSCGVLPVSASLRRHGAGKGATTAFLLSTPQTGVDSVAVTWALLGPFLAVFRPIAALITGVVGGLLVQFFDDGDNGEIRTTNETGEASCCSTDSCDAGSGRPVARWKQALTYGFVTLPRDIGRALFVGIVISGALTVLIQPNQLHDHLGGSLLSMLVAMAIGVPLYVCATASTPIALGLIHAGLSPGAALVFLISGPATNAAALTTLWKILGKRTTIVYLLTVVMCALAAGLAVDAAISTGAVDVVVAEKAAAMTGHQHEAGTWDGVESLSAVVLLAVLGFALVPRRKAERSETNGRDFDQTITLSIAGMTCNGCKTTVTRALSECTGVQAVDVDLESGSAVISGDNLDPVRLNEAVVSLGFEVRLADDRQGIR